MRILITGDTVGGVFTFVEQLAGALESYNCEVVLATFGPLPALPVTNTRWFHHCSKLEWQPDPWSDLGEAGAWLEHLVDREQPDVLHFNTLCHGDRRWRIPLLTTIHSCVPTWWAAVRKTDLPDEWNFYREAVEQSLQAANIVTFPSLALEEAFRTIWNLQFAEAHVVPNGIDGSQFFRAKKERFALSAGRFWDEAKNMPSLDKAARVAEWPIYLAGAANANTNCVTLGQLSRTEVRGWYSRASMFISSSIYEPFGLAILEAAASGCALLLSDIPSLRENWQDAAIFCEPEEIGAQLNKLVHNSHLRLTLQEQALIRSQRFTQTGMAAHYLKLYERARSYACAL